MLRACPSCGCHVRAADAACPHCGAFAPRGTRSGAAVLLGLALAGCPQDKQDTGATVIALYGDAPTMDADGDGYEDIAYGGDDCDDTDAAVHPGAEEAAEDGVDSNCDGEDDP